jgi:hypothetical protein
MPDKPPAPTPSGPPTALGLFTFLAIGFSTLRVAIWCGNRIVLIHHYGWSRFRAESLTFVATPKGHPWKVSNGDLMEVGFVHFLISGMIWMPLAIATLQVATRLIGRHRMFRFSGT